MSHSGSHHSSGRSSHSGSHHSSGSSHSGSHHSSGGGSTRSSHYSRTYSSHYHYRSSSGSGYYSDDEIPSSATVYNGSWYYKNGELFQYDINMDDEFVKANYDYSKTNWLTKLLKKSDSLFIVGFYLYGWFAVVLGILWSSNVLYEALCPFIENAILTDNVFYTLDDFLYYGQCIPFFLWLITVPVFTIRSVKRLTEYEKNFVIEVIKHYQKIEVEEEEECYSICPSCGASVNESTSTFKVKNCPYCGGSLKISRLQ